MKIKVCGMRHPENIRDLVALKPDYIGFIFYAASPRFAGHLPPNELIAPIPSSIKKTGVFVNSTQQQIEEIAEQYHLDAIQLHGDESISFCQSLKQGGLEIIKAFALSSATDLRRANTYHDVCDFFLFDTSTRGYGGSGKKFNWGLLHDTPISRPFFLSGGIAESDATTILNDCPTRPYAIDLNSRFETEPGLKEIPAIRRFMNQLASDND